VSASYETLDWSVEDGVLTLTLDRPDQLNAFTVTMAEELVAAFERASADDDVGAVVEPGGVRHGGADGLVGVVGDAGGGARAALHRHLHAGAAEGAHRLGDERDAPLARVGLPG
jgi:enoyl-CoA hydratase/carnithine racemase